MGQRSCYSVQWQREPCQSLFDQEPNAECMRVTSVRDRRQNSDERIVALLHPQAAVGLNDVPDKRFGLDQVLLCVDANALEIPSQLGGALVGA